MLDIFQSFEPFTGDMGIGGGYLPRPDRFSLRDARHVTTYPAKLTRLTAYQPALARACARGIDSKRQLRG